jgi:hypothetical protein
MQSRDYSLKRELDGLICGSLLVFLFLPHEVLHITFFPFLSLW